MLNIHKFLENPNEKVLADRFVNDSKVKKYIMGISIDGHAEALSNLIEIDGFLDDYTYLTNFLGKPILKTSDINKDSIVLVCATVRTRTIINILQEKGFYNVLPYPLFYRFLFLPELPLKIIKYFDEEFSKNLNMYNWVFDLLEESFSKKTFVNLLQYRSTCNLDYMKLFRFDPIGQYFEDFLNLKENEVFIDVGGFDGATSVEFIKHCPKYKSIYIFEPSENNLDKAKENLKNYKNINFIKKGLSNKKDIYGFDSSLGSASVISDSGAQSIEVDTLDNLVEEPVSFIKIDIEGWESMAIEGMKGHILNDHPKLAISVYHKVDDFWKIPQQVLDIRSDYKLYMRHYTEGTDETVMFFIPSI